MGSFKFRTGRNCLVCQTHVIFGGVLAPSEFAFEPWAKMTMPTDAFCVGEPTADLNHIGDHATGKMVNSGGVRRQVGIVVDVSGGDLHVHQVCS